MDLECKLIGRFSSQISSGESLQLLLLLLLLSVKLMLLLLFTSVVVSVDWFEFICLSLIVCFECSCSFSWKKRALYCTSTLLSKLGDERLLVDVEEDDDGEELDIVSLSVQALAAIAAKCVLWWWTVMLIILVGLFLLLLLLSGARQNGLEMIV